MFPGPRKLSSLAVATAVVSYSLIAYIYSFNVQQSTTVATVHMQSPDTTWNERVAYATFLGPPTSNVTANETADLLHDPYFTSVRLLNYQIRYAEKTRSAIAGTPFLVLVLPQVPTLQILKLVEEGATIVEIEPLDLPDNFDRNFIEKSRFKDVLSKLRLWQLTDYDKVLYLDADSFLLENLDDIFTDAILGSPSQTIRSKDISLAGQVRRLPDSYLMAASSDTYGDQTDWEEPGHVNYLCACFMLFAPSTVLFDHYIAVLTGPDAPKDAWYPEQDLLIQVHRQDGPMPWRRIPVGWSANDGEMNDELALRGGVRSLHVKSWDGAEGGNIAGEKYKEMWNGLVEEMENHYKAEPTNDVV